MGCNSSKYSSGEHNEGTTIVAIHVNGKGIVFGVDSRSSNEKYQGIQGNHKKQSEWHLTITDNMDKVFRMSSNSNIVAVMAGQGQNCIKMCEYVKGKGAQLQSRHHPNGTLSVSFVYEEMIKYLEGPDGEDKAFGTIIAGWDKVKGFQICRVFIKDNRIVKDRNCGYASLGSGQQWANDFMASGYHYNMTVEDAVDLVLKSLFYATLYDKYSGGILQVYLLNEEGCHKKSNDKSLLEAYCRIYEPCQEENILFLVCSSTQQPFTADDLITCFFRKYGTMAMAGHRVAHCVTKKQLGVGFYFHRLVFNSENQASKVYNQIAAENGQKSRPRDLSVPEIYKNFDYRVELNPRVQGRDVPVPVYVSRSSIDLLQEMLSTSRVK